MDALNIKDMVYSKIVEYCFVYNVKEIDLFIHYYGIYIINGIISTLFLIYSSKDRWYYNIIK